jgi:phenylalanyl-tRNA synthetase alpha chain
MTDANDIARLRADFEASLAVASSEGDLQALRDRFLGRKQGRVTDLFGTLAKAAPEIKRELGRQINELKAHIEQALDARRASIEEPRARSAGFVDVTLPGRPPAPVARRHPLTVMRERIESVFTRWGYEIVDGPETEDDWHCFEALNMPAEHPARDMQDTLYLERPFTRGVAGRPGTRTPPPADVASLLRTHTSAMQIHYMTRHEPPIRIIAPGRVYRRDNLDVTHTPMFQQVEGLVVGERVTMGDLKGTIVAFLQELFGEKTRVVFRPSFFPCTEPSADVFASCHKCGGSSCAMCKRTGFIEVLGCGMVHPAVFEAVGYPKGRYTGFAFGMGIERLALLTYGVDDIRHFYENDLRFLEQFPS